MDIRFKELTLIDFKGLRNFHLNFDENLTELYADNAQGKTTIVHSLFWLFFGKDANDNTKFELLPLDKDNNIIPDTVPTVSLKFLHGAKENVYTRAKKGSKTTYTINDANVTASEFKRHVDSVVSKELFSALLSPVYFGDNYDWRKQRDTILNNMHIENTVIQKFEFEDVAKEILEIGIEKTLEKYDSECKRLEKSKLEFIGTRDYLADKLKDIDTSITQEELVKQKELKEKEIRDSESALDSLHPIQTEISELERTIQKAEGDNIAIIREKQSKINSMKRENELEAKSKKREKELKISSLETEKGKLLAEYKRESTKLNDVMDVCPTCGNKLNEFEVDTQRDKFKKKLEEIKQQGLTKAEEIKSVQAELLAIKPNEVPLKEIEVIESEVVELQNRNIAEEEKIKVAKLKEKEQEIRAKVDYDKIQVQRNELRNIEKQVSDYEYTVKDKQDLDGVIKKLRDIMGDYDDSEEIVDAIKQYRTDYAEMVADTLNAKLDRVKIKTFDLQKDGTLKETFEISMDGVPYKALNSAGKIEAGIELIQLLSASLNICFPVIIDNKECITKDFDIPNQLITLSVKKGAMLNV